MDFDSTITEDSTLVRLYMLSDLFREKDKRKELERISNEFYAKEEELKARTYPKLINSLSCKTFDDFLKGAISIMNDYERNIRVYEMEGMRLVEPFLKDITIKDMARAASQIKVRSGFDKFIEQFNKNDRHIISCNWSDIFVNLVCRSQVPQRNIFSNKLLIKDDKCIGFNYNQIILTPLVKLDFFNKYKSKNNIYCGDSFPDLMPTILSDRGFVFKSHDRAYIELLKLVKERYNRSIVIVKDFNEARSLL